MSDLNKETDCPLVCGVGEGRGWHPEGESEVLQGIIHIMAGLMLPIN